MSAKEMFEALGYEIKQDGNQYLIYSRYCYDGYSGEFISFRKHQKKVGVFSMSESGNRGTRMATIDELKAINQQCKELGWLDE